MDLRLTPAQDAFRSEARGFLAARLPEALRRARRLTTTVFVDHDISLAWQRILHGQGWVAPSWPREHGGPGWDHVERHIWHVECARAGAPPVSPIGLSLVGPVLMRFGSDDQKARFLPRILSGEDYWCQGFSEPGAGSDLAALRTRAVPDGDDYVVEGSKIWTTHAHFANWMIALVRTSSEGPRQQGITCLLVPMDDAGVSVRPILTIGGDHEVNQVFLDAVRVPASLRVGAEGEGWAVAKYLLEFERGGEAASAGLRARLEEVARVAADRPEIGAAIAELSADLDALEMMELRASAPRGEGGGGAALASMLKLRSSQLQQDVSALALRAAGAAALRWDPRRPFHDDAGMDEARTVASRYLNNRANTIFGGAAEIQRGIIARVALGL